MEGPENSLTDNIILNHDFSEGLQSWNPNCCEGFVASASSGHKEGALANSESESHYAIVTNRKECWQGLEQDITTRILPGSSCTVSAKVKVAGPVEVLADVLATLKLDHEDKTTSYQRVSRYWYFFKFCAWPFCIKHEVILISVSTCRISVSKERWEKLEGTFSLTKIPKRVVFYLEGPSPGIDLLIESVVISCLRHGKLSVS